MITLYDQISKECSRNITQIYSTSFSLATTLFPPKMREAIYNIYGFVRLADEIVDTFLNHQQEEMLNQLESDLEYALMHRISINPVIHSFVITVHKYDINHELIYAFLKSMRADLDKSNYTTADEYEDYIYGSAKVVGLMCLKVFVNGDQTKYLELEHSATKLGSAFQKVNFLRDLKDDMDVLNRSYFPDLDFNTITEENKQAIIQDIEKDFKEAMKGIRRLPNEAKLPVYTAYSYYSKLLSKIKQTPVEELRNSRIRVSNSKKISLIVQTYFSTKLNLV